jgi:hypothetical protein
MKHYKNLKIMEVYTGFGWSREGDCSTNTISNILEDVDKEFGKQNDKIEQVKLLIKSDCGGSCNPCNPECKIDGLQNRLLKILEILGE